MSDENIVWSEEMNRTRPQDYFQGVILTSDTVILLVAPSSRDGVRTDSQSFERKLAAYVKEPLTAAQYIKRGLLKEDLAWDYQRRFIDIRNAEGNTISEDPTRASLSTYYASLSQPRSMYQSFEYSLTDGIALVRLNRPNKLNAIDNVMVREFGELAANVKADKNVRVVVFTGNGRAFCAGADIASLNSIENGGDFMVHIETIQKTFNALDDLDRPTIAAINGIAFGGGCELSLVCDFRIMAEEALIGVPEILIGVLPGAGGTQRLSKMLPPAIAKQMIYLGEPLKAAQALQFGLVNQVVPAAQVLDTAIDFAHRLLKMPPLGVRCAKLLVHTGMNADLKTGIEAERQAMAFLFGTEDRVEGMGAFLAKRQASFKGR